MQGRLGEEISSSWQTIGSRAMPLPVSPCDRDIFSLLCCPNPPRVKGCRRTQHVNERRRMTTELSNDAVNSLNWLAGHKNSSLTHVESRDDEHSALWPHLCDEALRRQSTALGERQGTNAALSALPKRMTDCSVSSSPGNLASYKKTAGSLPSGVHDCPHGWVDRPMVSGEQKRMRRDPKKTRVSRCLGSTMTQRQRGTRNCTTLLCEM